ncbi:MAG: DUF2304 domain-containing protein [Lachnospiraceae bacterium]|nr:DUF2304 domain-containing protein [Lachnospiraceae bacterium]
MSLPLRIFALILVILYLISILVLVKKNKLLLRYSLLWFFAGAVMLVIVIWPGLLFWAAGLLNIEVPANGLFGICILLGIILMISFTVVISDFSAKIKTLVQNQALLEERIRELEGRKTAPENTGAASEKA